MSKVELKAEDRALIGEPSISILRYVVGQYPKFFARLIDAAREEGRASALSDHRPPVEGWVTVPREPTEEMLDAADEVFHAVFQKQAKDSQRIYGKVGLGSEPFSTSTYRAMLAAAPPSPPVEALGVREEAAEFAATWRKIVDQKSERDQVANKNTVLRFCRYIEALSTAPLSLGNGKND